MLHDSFSILTTCRTTISKRSTLRSSSSLHIIVIFYMVCYAAGILDCLILGNTLLHEHGQGHRPGFKMANDKKAHF